MDTHVWVLIIWIAAGNSSSSAVPSKVAEYMTQAECQAAAAEWQKPGRGREAACLPGRRK